MWGRGHVVEWAGVGSTDVPLTDRQRRKPTKKTPEEDENAQGSNCYIGPDDGFGGRGKRSGSGGAACGASAAGPVSGELDDAQWRVAVRG